MNDFTASNGLKLSRLDGDGLRVAIPPDGYDGWQKLNLHTSSVVALGEFFQAEADERLGRWRWPENPDYVVYPRADHVAVVNEQSGNAIQATRGQAEVNTGLCRAARAYFDAHPEPKPWHDAQPGELWVIRLVDQEEIGVSVEAFEPGADVFQVPGGESISITRPSIVAGRRIWPKVSS